MDNIFDMCRNRKENLIICWLTIMKVKMSMQVIQNTAWDRGTDLEALIVPRLGIHENLQRIDLQRVRAFTRVVGTIFPLACLVQLSHLFRQLAIVFPIQPQPRQLDVGFEP